MKPAQHWQHKLVLITGAASGIGRSLAENLAQKGARLILADMDKHGLDDVQSMIGNKVVLVRQMDVSDKQQWQTLMTEIEDSYSCLDVIVNNAGMSNYDFFDHVPEDHFERVMEVNFQGVVNGCRYALPLLKKSENALIVNVASIFSMITVPCMTAYHASKFAVRGFSSALLQDIRFQDYDIDLVCVMPGGIKTNIARSTITAKGNVALFSEHFDKTALTSPEQAAKVIERGMRRRKFNLLVGPDAHIMSLLYRYFANSYHGITNRIMGVRKLLSSSHFNG